VKGFAVIAADPGPAVHLALLGTLIVVALVVYALVRIRRKREAARADELNRDEQ
jgi:hypothetical protein